ncbi:dTMP kinase [Catellatospora methionotrophica]|uniref:dTMP kinase n=1 Tax=Catellatospora methionotrophica TaxID=121620 RepID=UPI00340F5832
MKIYLEPHGRPGTLVAICGFDGSGKSTLEQGMLAGLATTGPVVPAWAPTPWWRNDAHVSRTLFGQGTGRVLPEQALLHFNLADCHLHQADVLLPALDRGELVVGNRYLYDMLALFEARGLSAPAWLPDAVAQLVRPDFCFVLDGPADVFVDRIIRRDGAMPGRFDQDVAFVERYNAALRRLADANGLTVLRAEADPAELVRQCLDVVRGARQG